MLRFSIALALLALLVPPLPAVADGASTAPSIATQAQPPSQSQAPRGWIRPPAKEGYSYPDCYCTDSTGNRVEVGQLACLRVGGREITSRCEEADNLTIWRHQGEGCPGV
ncbi:MAG: hypothetical protein AAF371_18475 [Pseudomonadota bacterium]